MLHYKPNDGYFGDPVPFYWDGEYHLFYLKAPLEPKRHGASFTSYAHISSRDFLHWTEHPLAIIPEEGAPDSQGCWTGSVIEKDGVFYLFYTGHDPEHPARPQSICLATSRNLDDWEKYPSNPILLPNPNQNDIRHWRDPFVFWNEEESCYWMTITTVMAADGLWKGGALVVARSSDLLQWTVGEVFYHPGNHNYPECSDLFKMGDTWYLVCSIFDKTCYRMALSPSGVWQAGLTDSFDGVLNYAAKTIGSESERYAMGWIRTKAGRRDSGAWEWGGHLSFPRQIWQGDKRELYVQLPAHFDAIRAVGLYDLNGAKDYRTTYGSWSKTALGIQTHSVQLYQEVELPGTYGTFDGVFEFQLQPGTRCAGVVFQADSKINHPGYEIAVDIKHQLMLFRRHACRSRHYTCQDIILQDEEPVSLRLIVENGIVEAFVNDRFALSSAFYHYSNDATIRFFIEEGAGVLNDARIHSLLPTIQPQALRTEQLSR